VTETAGWVPLTTERGTIVIKKSLAEQYRAGIRFMKEKNAKGQAVLSVPEDASLYFLSGTHCPTRILQFTPGSLLPGKMTEETIQEMDEKRVRYLVWSNRLFPEYGVLRFGTDFETLKLIPGTPQPRESDSDAKQKTCLRCSRRLQPRAALTPSSNTLEQGRQSIIPPGARCSLETAVPRTSRSLLD